VLLHVRIVAPASSCNRSGFPASRAGAWTILILGSVALIGSLAYHPAQPNFGTVVFILLDVICLARLLRFEPGESS
jgi:hypothetical protein